MLTTILPIQGKKLSIIGTTLKKVIVGGAENRAGLPILVGPVRVVGALLNIEILLFLELEQMLRGETNLIPGQHGSLLLLLVHLLLSATSLIIR